MAAVNSAGGLTDWLTDGPTDGQTNKLTAAEKARTGESSADVVVVVVAVAVVISIALVVVIVFASSSSSSPGNSDEISGLFKLVLSVGGVSMVPSPGKVITGSPSSSSSSSSSSPRFSFFSTSSGII